jgi:hypothetical protein
LLYTPMWFVSYLKQYGLKTLCFFRRVFSSDTRATKASIDEIQKNPLLSGRMKIHV